MIYDIKLFIFKVIIIPVGKICLFCRGTRRERERERVENGGVGYI